jgi:hypothetical protein
MAAPKSFPATRAAKRGLWADLSAVPPWECNPRRFCAGSLDVRESTRFGCQ